MSRRRALLAAAAVSAPLTGCLGGLPVSSQVKFAARSWASARLHPRSLQVMLVSVAADQQRARVHVLADGRRYRLRLQRSQNRWRVVAAKR
jgi:hypothetical protein